MQSNRTTLTKKSRCSHEQTVASAVADMERLVCEACGYVTIKFSGAITPPGIPTPRHEVGAK